MSKLLLRYALDKNNSIIHINDAVKGEKYKCPSCGSELLLRLSKIPEGQKYHRTNHFAHKGGIDNHCSESFLHRLFKQKATEFIKSKINAREPFFFEWDCEQCYEHHKGNLLQKAVEVVEDGKFKTIHITLKYGKDKNEKIITGLKRISKPGLRVYADTENLPKVLGGLGVAIISTNKGVLTDKEARNANVGGEVLAYIW